LPVIDRVAADYQDRVTFVAVAGRSSLGASAERVGVWFSPDRILWGYSDDIWALYGIPGQPVSVLVTVGGFEVDRWFGASPESDIRVALDRLVSYG